MKKITVILLLLVAWNATAQIENQNVRPVTASQTIQTDNYTIQVGIPTLGTTIGQTDRTTDPLDIRFPWDVLYLPNTFSETSFDVSKGYFGDMIRVSWTLQANFDLVSNIAVFRREFTEDDSNEFIQIANTAPIATEYEDEFVEGGTLYEYKIEAQGIGGNPGRLLTFIDGIGYRSPTAIVTGSVNFEGGNPVQDVVIRATTQAGSADDGTALAIPSLGALEVSMPYDNDAISTAATLQAFVKPQTPFTAGSSPIRLFSLSANNLSGLQGTPIHTNVSLNAGADELTVSIGGNDYVISEFYPSGELLADGTDELIAVSNFNSSFIHISVQLNEGQTPLLFINGRLLNTAYQDANNDTYPGFSIVEPTGTTSFTENGMQLFWNTIDIGGENESLVDEVRIWKNSVSEENIRTDYRRFINGNNTNLISYLRANEGVGSFAYDLSRTGFDYNNNHGTLYKRDTPETDRATWVSGEGNSPTQQQLGVLGVTDANGNYEITAIPYSGTGESFNITPLLGVHEFDPNQQLVFLGQGAEVVNSINFTDISSFSFKGRILYDSRGIFPPIAGDEIFSPDIDEVGYNQYEVAGTRYQKGEWWRNDNDTPGDLTDDFLEHYAKIYSEGINIFIDGDIVLDENNIPVTTDAEGFFDISVPIGNHFITIGQTDHAFVFEGRFPAASGTLQEFFEDSNQPETFIDSTRLSLVGRVVGGSVESAKPIGFGENGLFTQTVLDDEGTELEIEISSKNNIGIANLTLAYAPPGGTDTFETRIPFSTNETSGEYRVEVLPLNYTINQTTGAQLQNNDDSIVLLTSNETVNLFAIPQLSTPEAQLPDGTIITGEDYHLEKSIIYRSTPVLRVDRQTSDNVITINDVQYATAGFEITPGNAVKVYSQLLDYDIDLKRFERYTNYDDTDPVEDEVPIIDGELLVTNNLALDDTESIIVDSSDPSILHYSFKGGMPNISIPFTRTIDLQYRINGIDYPAENYEPDGIIMGGISDGSNTFLTAAPDVPDFILRDPPGSNSFATLESGQTLTLNVSNTIVENQGVGESINILAGVTTTTGGGLAGPVIESQGVNEATLGIEASYTSETGKNLSKSFTFNQSISTSAETDFVGSEGDLFIGQSKNYFYGSYDDVFPSTTMLGGEPALELTNTNGESIFISKQKSMYFNEDPSDTFFVLSQKNVLETTIPGLEQIIENIDLGLLTPGVDGVQSRDFYVQQIFLWRKTLLKNEIAKYRAFTEAQVVKDEIIARIDAEIELLNEAIANLDNGNFPDPLRRDELASLYSGKTANAQLIKNAVESNFEDNISFDAGVGSIERSVETSTVIEVTESYEVEVESSFALQLGFTLNKVGIITNTTGKIGGSINSSIGETTENTSTISYTLQDNDPDNLLSVDVINMFDGSGVVFATVGGSTSCPYEDQETALFYDNLNYDPDATVIEPLPEGTGAVLSAATQRIEVPIINVNVASVTNVPETQNAEFILLLENNSVTETDATFVLRVDNTTNPNNAIINIEPNGTIVSVPYGEQTPYALTLGKSISDVFDYQDIRIILESTCDGEDVSDDVFISATFVPACSSVAIGAPLDNWVYNRDVAFNADGGSNPLPITMQGYNLAFSSFQKIDLEYRLATAASWNRLQTYYTTQEFLDEAIANSETDIALIDASTINFTFDIVAASLQDGQYELRARTSCINGTEFISEPVLGTVDLTAPRRFNSPSPQDGILSSGDDIKASFNEDIFFNSALSEITITGRTNQLPINNSVSVRFDGGNDQAIIVDPDILNGDFSLQFWMLNENTTGTATILNQEEGISLVQNGANLVFTIGDNSVNSAIPPDGLFHHYTFTYDEELGRLSAYRDDTTTEEINDLGILQYSNSNDLEIGSPDFFGNIHDLRLWSKSIQQEDATANSYTQYLGNERNLIGYWPMNEGRGDTASDLARFNNMIIDAAWDIKPKGESYQFENGQYQTLDNVNFVQLIDETDATISFWMKTATAQEATIFSNGRGDGTDLVQANGLQNKWAINLDVNGILSFASEGNGYPLTTQTVADDNWHHIALLMNRTGSLLTFVDGSQVSSNPTTDIGGFSGGNIWLGARGQTDDIGAITIDREYTGQLDEFRLWNTIRNQEQVLRDQYMEIDPFTIGLLLYARMNEPDPQTGDGPTYYHAFSNGDIITSEAVLNTGVVNYNNDSPAIKPEREIVSFQVNRVINGDEIIIEPVISNPASIEGQILDITVHRMFDAANNRQESPITWTAFVQRNDVSWFAPGFNEVIDIIKQEGEDASFEITLVNQGGNNQPYTIANIPSWLSIEETTGVLSPNSSITLIATVSNDITAGDYIEDLFLETDFDFDQKLQLDLKVLAEAPNWNVNPNDYQFSMNVIGRITVDNNISRDPFDRIGAFVDGEVRGSANLVYDQNYDEYFLFLTVYSNINFGEDVTYRIWDASQGAVLNATVDSGTSNTFSENDVIGTLSNPTLFENSGNYFQELQFNQGWTWISMNVNDVDFQDIDQLTAGMDLQSLDRILSTVPGESYIELYYEDPADSTNSSWSGTISSNGGMSSSKMYKIFTANPEQSLIIEGPAVDIESFTLNIVEGWNWFPYPYNSSHNVNESLSLLEPGDGDVIKSQTEFAIYDLLNGWSGTLTSLEGGNGYMLLSSTAQEFSFPTYLNRNSNTVTPLVKKPTTISNFASFETNMNAVVRVPEGYTEVFIYDQAGNLRGAGQVESFNNDENLSYITIYGETMEDLKFYVSKGNERIATQQQFTFKGNNVLGTTEDPIQLTLFESGVNIYPNPFNNEINFDFILDKDQKVDIQIYNSLNQLILRQTIDVTQENNSHKLETRVPAGIYFMHILTQENTWVEKIIKK